jgi:hypothetical protein
MNSNNRTCKGVAACDALCEYNHVRVHAIKVLVAPPLARAASTRLDLQILGEGSDTCVWTLCDIGHCSGVGGLTTCPCAQHQTGPLVALVLKRGMMC